MSPNAKQLVRQSPFYGAAKFVQEQSPAHVRARKRRLEFYAQFVKADALVFDVGANVGNRVEVFLGLGARVVAVEPQLLCVRMLKARFGKRERFTVLPYGLAAEPGVQDLYVADAHVLSSMSTEAVTRPIAPGTTWAPPIPVTVTTMDAVIGVFGVPAFVKIDVEGFEENVLGGLNQPVPALSLESNPGMITSTLRCLDKLDSLGPYEYSFSQGESMALTFGWGSSAEIRSRLPGMDWGDVYARLV